MYLLRTHSRHHAGCSPEDFHRLSSCELCDARFGVLRGRHHCRICCRTVCSVHFRRPLCVACELDRVETFQRYGRHGSAEGASEAVTPSAMEAGDSADSKSFGGTEDVFLCMDVYATAFTLANNATPGLYSFNPFINRDMILVWIYLVFISFSQVSSCLSNALLGSCSCAKQQLLPLVCSRSSSPCFCSSAHPQSAQHLI